MFSTVASTAPRVARAMSGQAPASANLIWARPRPGSGHAPATQFARNLVFDLPVVLDAELDESRGTGIAACRRRKSMTPSSQLGEDLELVPLHPVVRCRRPVVEVKSCPSDRLGVQAVKDIRVSSIMTRADGRRAR